MRLDKLTTKFQGSPGRCPESPGLGADHAYIGAPAHPVGHAGRPEGPAPCWSARPWHRARCSRADAAAVAEEAAHGARRPPGTGQPRHGAAAATGREGIAQGDDKFIASEMFLAGWPMPVEAGQLVRGTRPGPATPAEQAIRPCRVAGRDSAEAEGQRRALKKYTLDLTERAAQGKLDPVFAAMTRSTSIQVLQRRSKQPGADRRARRGQDRHRGGPGPAHRPCA